MVFFTTTGWHFNSSILYIVIKHLWRIFLRRTMTTVSVISNGYDTSVCYGLWRRNRNNWNALIVLHVFNNKHISAIGVFLIEIICHWVLLPFWKEYISYLISSITFCSRNKIALGCYVCLKIVSRPICIYCSGTVYFMLFLGYFSLMLDTNIGHYQNSLFWCSSIT